MQTSYPTEERLGRPGHPYDGAVRTKTRTAEVAMRPGDLAIRGTHADSEGKGAKRLTAPAAADDDAIIATIASAGSPQTIDGAGLDGAIGGARIFPPRNLTLTLSNHANWDATTAIVTGEDEYGRVITESFAIPDTGNTVLTGSKVFSRVHSLYIPTQSGTAGTARLGTGTLLGPLTSRDVLGIVRYLAARQLAEDATAEFAQYDTLAIIEGGRVWVEVEEDVDDGEQVYVRLVAAGDEEVGGIRNDRDGTAAAPDAVPVIGMRFNGDSIERDSVKMAVVEFDFTGA